MVANALDYRLGKPFYQQRRERRLPAELKKCLYQNPGVKLNQIIVNLISYPIKALTESGFFEYVPDIGMFSLRPDLKNKLTEKNTAGILDVCKKRLEQYYSQRF